MNHIFVISVVDLVGADAISDHFGRNLFFRFFPKGSSFEFSDKNLFFKIFRLFHVGFLSLNIQIVEDDKLYKLAWQNIPHYIASSTCIIF